MERRLTIAALLAGIGFTASFASPLSALADDDPFHRAAGGLSVYIGVMSAAIVKGHPISHAEATMHGGAPSGPHEYHLVAAVFDDASGQRISDAQVSAKISGPGETGNAFGLEPMSIEDTITYGGFASFPSSARYAIHIEVTRPKAPLVSFDFSYDHEPP